MLPIDRLVFNSFFEVYEEAASKELYVGINFAEYVCTPDDLRALYVFLKGRYEPE